MFLVTQVTKSHVSQRNIAGNILRNTSKSFATKEDYPFDSTFRNISKSFAKKEDYPCDSVELEINNELKVSSDYNFDYPIPNQGSLNVGLSSLINYRPKSFFPNMNGFNNDDTTDIWLSHDGFLLITTINTDDFYNLDDCWEKYGFEDRVGPAKYTEYGTLSDIVDDR